MSTFDYVKPQEKTYAPYAPPHPARQNRRQRRPSGFGRLRLLFEITLVLIIVILLAEGGNDSGSAAAPDEDTVTASELFHGKTTRYDDSPTLCTSTTFKNNSGAVITYDDFDWNL